MKIEGNSPGADVRPVGPAADDTRVKSGSGRTTQQAGSTSLDDTLELSPQAHFVRKAMEAAASAPEIREDRVARARAKLEAGEIGQDALQLANRLIDHLLES
jgi:flagellar biosynthesis anti-sigma factor FlgM